MARTYVNDVTGDPIVSKVAKSNAYQSGWDRIFGNKKKVCGGDGCPGCEFCQSTGTSAESSNQYDHLWTSCNSGIEICDLCGAQKGSADEERACKKTLLPE